MGRKLRVWCDSGANIHSCREEVVEFDDLGFSEEEWDAMSDEDKYEAVRDVALEKLDWGFEEIDA